MKRIALLIVAIIAGCGVPEDGIAPPDNEFYDPLGIVAHPDGRYLYVANSVFDRKYNAGTMVVYDTETRAIVPESTIEVGLFSGELALVSRIDTPDQVTAFMVTREKHQLAFFNLEGETTLIPGDTSPISQFGTRPFATDPYSVSVDGKGLYISHLGRGRVSRWAFKKGTNEPVYQCDVNLPDGATAIARHPVLGWAYVTDRFGNEIQIIEEQPKISRVDLGLTDNNQRCNLVRRGSIRVNVASQDGRTRGLAFSADGTMLYVASITERSIRVYDTTLNSNGRPRSSLLATIPVGSGPNIIRVAGLRPGEVRPPDGLDRGKVGEILDAKGGGLIYVTLLNADRVAVIDPATLTVVAQIDVGEGPHDLAFMPDVDGNLRGYVTNFRGNDLSLIDLEPGSPSRFEMKAQIR